MFLVILAAAALALALAAAFLPPRRHAATGPAPPPVVPGLPWLGSAISLGIHGADFLSSCKRKYGDAFTVVAAGQRLTFLFAPVALERFFRLPQDQLSFLPAVEQWTWRVFRLPPQDFIPRHGAILRAMRAAVGARGLLESHAMKLLPLLEREIKGWVDERDQNEVLMELSGAVAEAIFAASVESLFGGAFLQRHGTETLRSAFFAFEGGFELAASPLPQALQPRFRAARATLLSAFAASLAAGDFKGTVVGELVDGTEMPHSAAPHMLLAVLWASQANTVPTAFWALGFLLLPENQIYASQIRSEILQEESSSASELLTESATARLIDAACDPSSLLTRCCMEAIRLRSSSTDVRIAAQDLVLPCEDTGSNKRGGNSSGGVLIKKGSMVVLCPWISHTDPRIYPEDPLAFDPGRPGAALPGGRRLHSPAAGVGGVAGVAFGGGRFRCPGRGFAEMELGLIVGLVLAALEVEFVVPAVAGAADGKKVPIPGDPGGLLPRPELRKLVGVKVPESASCWVRVRRREQAAEQTQRRRSARLRQG